MFKKSAQANNKMNIKAQDQKAFVGGTTDYLITVLPNHHT